MNIVLNYILTGEECASRLGALYIAECRRRNVWNTGRFKRIREKHLKDVPEETLKYIYDKCDYWGRKGVPHKFAVDVDTFRCWQAVLNACAEYDCMEESGE